MTVSIIEYQCFLFKETFLTNTNCKCIWNHICLKSFIETFSKIDHYYLKFRCDKGEQAFLLNYSYCFMNRTCLKYWSLLSVLLKSVSAVLHHRWALRGSFLEIHVVKAPCPIARALQYSFLCFQRTETVIRLIKWPMASTISFVNTEGRWGIEFLAKVGWFCLNRYTE